MANIDLTSLLQIEKSYSPSIGVVNPPNKVNEVQPVVDDLNQMNTAYENAKLTTGNILDHQNDMQVILDNEQSRLNQKKQSIDSAITTQQRMIQLNESYQKRYSFMTKIIIVVTILLILILLTSTVSKYFPIVPDFLIYTINIILITFGIIYLYRSYVNFNRRSQINFDEIVIKNQPPSNGNSPTSGISDMNVNGGGNLNLTGLCIGQQCCSNGTTWNAETATCVSSPGSSPLPFSLGFSPSTSPSSNIQPFTTMTSVEPLVGFEYSQYGKYGN